MLHTRQAVFTKGVWEPAGSNSDSRQKAGDPRSQFLKQNWPQLSEPLPLVISLSPAKRKWNSIQMGRAVSPADRSPQAFGGFLVKHCGHRPQTALLCVAAFLPKAAGGEFYR